jgi:hypothetical protein
VSNARAAGRGAGIVADTTADGVVLAEEERASPFGGATSIARLSGAI